MLARTVYRMGWSYFRLGRGGSERCGRKAPGSYLVAQTASRGAGLGTESSNERIMEAFVLGKGSLGPSGEGMKAHEGRVRLL